MDIIGVDFSGAVQEGKTWVATGNLHEGCLTLTHCAPISRQQLTDELKNIKEPVIVAMDFPFGLPCGFIREELGMNATKMPEVWKYTHDKLNLPKYIPELRDRLRNGDLKKYSKLKRKGDANFPGSYSPLNPAGPEMFPMTFYGMHMLHKLRKFGFHIPPLPPVCDDSPTAQSTLLETMPGVVLKALGLPHYGYKESSKNPLTILENRRKILHGLKVIPQQLHVCGLDEFRDECLVFNDCLDAIVAAVAAAMWHRDRSIFRCPTEGEKQTASLEGWLYAPKSQP